MKNKKTLLAILAIALVLGMTACGGGGGGSGGRTPVDNSVKGGTVPVKIRAYNNKGIAPSKSVVFNGRAAVMSGSEWSVQTDFAGLNELYNNFGAKQGSGITPTKFYLYVGVYAYTSTGDRFYLGQGYFDFASGKTITLGEEIPRDVTIVAIKFYGLDVYATTSQIGNSDLDYTYVEIDWPFYTGTNDNNGKKTNFEASPYFRRDAEVLPFDFKPTIIDGKASFRCTDLSPVLADSMLRSMLNGYDFLYMSAADAKKVINSIIYGGDSRKLYYGVPVPVSDIIPGVNKLKEPEFQDYPDDILEYGFAGQGGSTIVVPFSPITIPSNASSVTFEVSWDLQNLVDAYKTSNNNETVVLKNGFWESLYINVKID